MRLIHVQREQAGWGQILIHLLSLSCWFSEISFPIFPPAWLNFRYGVVRAWELLVCFTRYMPVNVNPLENRVGYTYIHGIWMNKAYKARDIFMYILNVRIWIYIQRYICTYIHRCFSWWKTLCWYSIYQVAICVSIINSAWHFVLLKQHRQVHKLFKSK